MKLLLIKAGLNRFHGQASPPLGLLYISAYLRRHGYTDIGVLHPDAQGMDNETLAREIATRAPDVIAISAITAEARSMHLIAGLARGARPGATVIVGGPHPTAYPEDCAGDANIAIIVRNEGERTMLAVIRALENNGGLRNVPGIIFRDGATLRDTGPAAFESDLDCLPFPDRDSLPAALYSGLQPMTPVLFPRLYANIITSRGCPFRCSFCHSVHGKNYRAHSPARVIEEISLLREKYGITDIEVQDDTFNFDPERTREILEGIIARGLRLRLYICGVRGDLLNRGLVELFKEAGVRFVGLGIETADPGLQAAIGKNVDLAKMTDSIRLLNRAGIFTTGAFMFGLPGETCAAMFRTALYAARSQLHTAMFATCVTYKGTPLGATLPQEKLTGPDGDLYLYSDCSCPAGASEVQQWRINLIKRLANALFYLNPARLARIALDLPHFSPRLLLLLARKLLFRTILP